MVSVPYDTFVLTLPPFERRTVGPSKENDAAQDRDTAFTQACLSDLRRYLERKAAT